MSLKLEDILIFFTETDREPPTGFYPQPTMNFSDDDLATASTCGMRLVVPIKHISYDQFREKMIFALKRYDGFGKTISQRYLRFECQTSYAYGNIELADLSP